MQHETYHLIDYYKRLPLGAVLKNCIADHGKEGKEMSKVIVWLYDNRVTISLAIYLSSYHYSANLVHGPLVNPFQYHTIGSGAGGGAGEATAPPSENKREAQPLPPPLTEVYVCFKAL